MTSLLKRLLTRVNYYMPNKELFKEWELRARDDKLSIEDILDSKNGSPNTVCFLCQQMAEKLLKGFLVLHSTPAPKIHHLDRLVKLCENIDSSFSEVMSLAEELSEFYISTRYPGDYPRFTFKEAEKAFEKGLKIEAFIQERL